MEIALRPFGDIDSTALETLKAGLYRTFGCPVLIDVSIPVPVEAFTTDRNQYLSDIFLNQLRKFRHNNNRVLGITEVDLYTDGLNFVFGQADCASGTAVISLHLLHQEHYGLPEDTELFLARCLKEAVHELGHTFGMEHCQDGCCVMHFSNSLLDTDVKKAFFCPRCQPKLMF